MSSRNRMPVLNARSGLQNGVGRPSPYGQVRPQMGGPPSLSGGPMPGMLEQKIQTQHIEIQGLLTENQRLAATHVALRQELAAAQQEMQRLNSMVAGIQSEKDAQIRSLLEKSAKLESELRATETVKQELHQARADCQKLHLHSQDLTQQLRTTTQELQRGRTEMQQVPVLRSEVESLRGELQRARTAFEYEKKANAEQQEQRQAMEKNLVDMARDLEKLRAEATNATKRIHPGGAVYNGSYAGSEVTYGLPPQQGYGDVYGMNSQEAGPTSNGIQHPNITSENEYGKALAESTKLAAVQDTNNAYHALTGTQVQDTHMYRTNADIKAAEQWATHVAPDGKPYYFNTITGETQWEKPAALETQNFSQAHLQQQGAHVQSLQPGNQAPNNQPLLNGQVQQSPLISQVPQQQPTGTTMTSQQLGQTGAQIPQVAAGQHSGGYMPHSAAHVQQPGLYGQQPGVYMSHTGTYMYPPTHMQQPGAYLQHSGLAQAQAQAQAQAGQSQHVVPPLPGQMHAPLGVQPLQVAPLQGQTAQNSAPAPMPHLVHGHLSYPAPGVPSHQGPMQTPGGMHPMNGAQMPPLMSVPAGQQPLLQSPHAQPNQAGSRPGAYSTSGTHQQQQQNQQNLQPSPRHGQTPSRASAQPSASPSSQAQTQGTNAQAGHTPHVSAPPVMHPRPQVSDTTTPPVKSTPPPPPTANSGPQGANLFVFGIPEDMGDKKLADLFTPFGAVIYSKVGVEKDTGRNRTYGFVSMDSSQSAEAAIHQVNGMVISGKRIKVELKRGDTEGHTHQNQQSHQNQQHQHQQQPHQHQAPSGGAGPTRWAHQNGNTGYRPY